MKQISKNLAPAEVGEVQSSEKTHSSFTGEWVECKLGEISSMGSGGTPNSKEAKYYGGDIKWVSIADMTGAGKYLSDTKVKLTQSGLENSPARIYSAPVILYAMYASLGEVSIATNNVSSSQAILGISVDKSVSLEYIYYLLLSYKPIVKTLGQQGTQSNLNKGMVQEFQFKIPASKSEQQAIMQVLSDIDSYISAQNRLISKKRLMKQGSMQQLLTGLTRLPGFEGEWSSSHLGDIGTFRGGTGFPLHFQGSSHGEIPFFKVSDMNLSGNESQMLFSNHSVEASQLSALGASPFEAGSIIFAKVGAAVFLERKRLLVRPSCLDNNMAGFSLDSKLNDSQFFYYWFQGFQLSGLVAATALPSINNSQLRKIEASYPKLEEQLAIAKVLSDMDAEIDALVARRDKTVLIKNGMMQDLLTGKVRL